MFSRLIKSDIHLLREVLGRLEINASYFYPTKHEQNVNIDNIALTLQLTLML